MIFTRRHPVSGHPLFREHLFVPPDSPPRHLSSPPPRRPSRVSHFKRVRGPSTRRTTLREEAPPRRPFHPLLSRVPVSGRQARRGARGTITRGGQMGGVASRTDAFFRPAAKCLYVTRRCCLPYVGSRPSLCRFARASSPGAQGRAGRGTKS